jgi:hypothetical protein
MPMKPKMRQDLNGIVDILNLGRIHHLTLLIGVKIHVEKFNMCVRIMTTLIDQRHIGASCLKACSH